MEWITGVRPFAGTEIKRHRTWTNAEWGFRHYLEDEGAMPSPTGAQSDRRPAGNEFVRYRTADRTRRRHFRAHHYIPDPRIVGLGTNSAYSSTSFGLAPFGLSLAPMDRVQAVIVSERNAELSELTIGTAEAERQIVSGVYNNDRWTSNRATVVLKRPSAASRIEAKFVIPATAPARTVQLFADGKRIAGQTLSLARILHTRGPRSRRGSADGVS